MSETSFPPIQQRLMDFIRREFRPGYNHYNVTKLVGDASARQYFRYLAESGESYILAAYPEAFDPRSFTYKQVYDLLLEIGLPVPRIHSMDGKLGIVLQEDLGDLSLRRELVNASPQEKRTLLCRALDHIVAIQQKGTAALKPEYEASRLAFDEEKLDWELLFFRKHYIGNYRKLPLDGIQAPSEEKLIEEFSRLARELAGYPRVLCHRDYHVRNLMLKSGLLYLIDFQDARMGPPAYDVVSLLKDSIDLSAEEVDDLTEYYLSQFDCSGRSTTGPGPLIERPLHSASFERQFHLMCIQRLLKALGTYGYQVVVRGNFIYEQYIPGSLYRTLLSLRALPEFPYIHSVVEKELEGYAARLH